MNLKLTLQQFRNVTVFLIAAFQLFETNAKCPYSPVTFSASYVDSGYLFYNSGKVDLPVKFDFGDGQTFYGVRPKNGGIFHKYTQNGYYKVTMYYNDTIQYCKDTAVQFVCFFKMSDSISYIKSNDTLYTEAPCLNHAFYRWSYGDNTYGKNCKSWHIYAKTGFYYPLLMFVIDTPSGCYYNFKTQYKQLDFSKCGFIADFYNEKYMGMSPLQLKAIVASGPFMDSNKKQNGRETWYWGDGSSTTQNTIEMDKDTHFYATKGLYNICHVYEDSLQCKDSVCKLIEVDSCNAYAQFTYSINLRDVTFTYKAAGNFSWYVDGQKINLTNNKYTFPQNGTYNVCLKSTGLDNCQVESCSTITVFKCESLSRSKINWNLDRNDCSKLHFINSNSEHQIFHWDFGDNSFSSDKEPEHTFLKDSTYRIKLSATDTIYGCKDSIEFLVQNYCCNIQDSIIVTKTSGFTAKIENFSYIRKPRGPVHRHKWIYNWTDISYDANPAYTFYQKGPKYFIYVAYDTIKRCSDSTIVFITIDSLDFVPFHINGGNQSVHSSELGQTVKVYPN
ncbi:MAG: PKD domain-containing protein, partial [Bacteroidetes bacterium]|nr:PKD domain-containing protein [Bacteroidota bacterium]